MVVELEKAYFGKKNFLAIKPVVDSRSERSLEDVIAATFKGLPITNVANFVLSISEPKQLSDYIMKKLNRDLNIVAFDETQFFGQWIIQAIKTLAWQFGLDVLVSGLDTDYKREGFGPMPEIMAIADEVHKLKAVCFECGQEAQFTQKLTGLTTSEIEVGNTEKYEARCGKCYYEYVG